jgi:hypothetical protein
MKQPYANLVAGGRKTTETRSWRTNYRGDIVIVSSKGDSLLWEVKPSKRFGQVPKESALLRRFPPAAGEWYPLGCAICVVELVGCRPMTREDEEAACCEVYPRAQAWTLRNPRTFLPFEMKGRLGLFRLSPGERVRVLRSLSHADS